MGAKKYVFATYVFLLYLVGEFRYFSNVED